MFELYQSESNRQYHFRLKAGNGEIILSSQGYASKDGCKGGIESVQNNATREEAYHLKEAKDGRHYFTLVAANGEVIGQSQMYKSTTGLKKGVASVMDNAPTAEVHDLT